MNEREKLQEAMVKTLTEDEYKPKMTPETERVYKMLKLWEEEHDNIFATSRGVEISLHRGHDNNLYGTIDCENKTTKLATGSGPNPLDKDFVKLIKDMSELLHDYKHLHY